MLSIRPPSCLPLTGPALFSANAASLHCICAEERNHPVTKQTCRPRQATGLTAGAQRQNKMDILQYGHAHQVTRGRQFLYLILLSVLKRIHCGIGLFCLAFLASMRLILKVFCDGCNPETLR